MTSSSSPIC